MTLEAGTNKKESVSEITKGPERQANVAAARDHFLKVIDNPEKAIEAALLEKGFQQPGAGASEAERKAYTAEKSRTSMGLMDSVTEKITALNPEEQDEFIRSMRAMAKFDPVINESLSTLLGIIPNSDLYSKFISKDVN